MTPRGNNVIHVPNKLLALFIALFILWTGSKETVMAREVDEYAVKAAFAFNFVRFVQWPDTSFADAADPCEVCFMGDERVAKQFNKVAKQFNAVNGKKKGARTISVRRLSSEKDYQACEIVFISRDIDRSILSEIISKAKGKPVLTISEINGFAALGGGINFFSKDNRLQFEINPGVVKTQGLKLSSRLLKLAVIVGGEE
jgi:hypothetical protein